MCSTNFAFIILLATIVCFVTYKGFYARVYNQSNVEQNTEIGSNVNELTMEQIVTDMVNFPNRYAGTGANLPFSPFMLEWFRIPEFIMDFIRQDKLLFTIFIIIAFLANLICFLFLFFLPNTLFNNKSIKVAWKEGFKLLKTEK